MLSEKEKSELVQSLKDDYVVLTDTVVEIVGDLKIDMAVLEFEGRALPNQKKDRQKLLKLKSEYSQIKHLDPVKAVDLVEKIFELAEKYDAIRMRL